MTLKKLFRNLWFKFHERTYNDRLKYLFENNHSNSLIVSFSGFPGDGKPSYNYVRTLSGNKKIDKLFILDDFGCRGSYYVMEDGEYTPRELVKGLIAKIMTRGEYKNVYTMGSSKGGTAAIYYGLECNATAVYSGACQYYIGNYLNKPQFAQIFKGMTGREQTEDVVDELNSIMPKQLERHAGCKTVIHLLYSKEENTYRKHTIGLISDLKRFNIPFVERVEEFPNHDDVGKFFSPYLKAELSKEVSKNS